MTFKEILEIMAAILTITVSVIFLYGAFMGVRKKFFQRLHNVMETLEGKLEHIKDGIKKD